MTLETLRHDPELLKGAPAPLFPGALVLHERAYLDVLEFGNGEEATATRGVLSTAIEELIDGDRRRMHDIEGRPESAAEREFLRTREAVLDARLLALAGDVAHHREAERLRADDALSPNGSAGSVPPPRGLLAWSGRTRRDTVIGDGAQDGSPRHRDDIQGLRAIAVLLVAISHAGVAAVAGGYVGVDVFFVLSGFLITGLLLGQARQRRYVSLAEFYLRRARRILPAAALTLVTTDIVAYQLLNVVRAKQVLQDSIPSALFAANIHFASIGTDYFAQGQPLSPLQHFWSLAVEEQFYVVWPALFALGLGLAIRKRPYRPGVLRERAVTRVLALVTLIGIVSLAFSIYYTPGHTAAAYFSTPARMWELALGAALAIGATRLRNLPMLVRLLLGWGGVAAIGVAAATFSSATAFPGYAALLPTVGTAMVLSAGIPTARLRLGVGRLLSLAPMRYIGDRSYTFYLWHWPVLIIAEQYKGHTLPVRTNLLLLLGAFALSIVTYRIYERPIRIARWARRPEALLLWPASVVIVLAVAGTYLTSISVKTTRQQLASQQTALTALAATPVTSKVIGPVGAPQVSQLLPTVVSEVKADQDHRAMPAVLHPAVSALLGDIPSIPSRCMAHAGETTSTLCNLGDSASAKKLLVIGDSHAEMWIPALLAFAHRDGWDVVTLLKSACSPPLWTSTIGPAECRSWFHWAVTAGAAVHADVTLIAGEYSHFFAGPDAATLDGFRALVGAMKPAAKHVVLLGDAPQRNQQPVDCLLRAGATPVRCSDTLSSDESTQTTEVSQLAQSENVGFIDTTGWFCDDSTCPLIMGNLVAYRDDNHITATYSTALGNVLRTALSAVTTPAKS